MRQCNEDACGIRLADNKRAFLPGPSHQPERVSGRNSTGSGPINPVMAPQLTKELMKGRWVLTPGGIRTQLAVTHQAQEPVLGRVGLSGVTGVGVAGVGVPVGVGDGAGVAQSGRSDSLV